MNGKRHLGKQGGGHRSLDCGGRRDLALADAGKRDCRLLPPAQAITN